MMFTFVVPFGYNRGLIPTRAYNILRDYCGHDILCFFLQLPVSSPILLACIYMYVCLSSVRASSTS